MKTTTLIIGILFTALTVNAQWYFNQYGVTDMNELNQDQLELAMQQATKLKKAGVGVSIASTAVTIIGFVIYANGLNDIVEEDYAYVDENANKAYGGLIVGSIGMIGMCVGIPMWIAGGTRINVIKVHLAKFEPTGQLIPSVGFTYRF